MSTRDNAQDEDSQPGPRIHTSLVIPANTARREAGTPSFLLHCQIKSAFSNFDFPISPPYRPKATGKQCIPIQLFIEHTAAIQPYQQISIQKIFRYMHLALFRFFHRPGSVHAEFPKRARGDGGNGGFARKHMNGSLVYLECGDNCSSYK